MGRISDLNNDHGLLTLAHAVDQIVSEHRKRGGVPGLGRDPGWGSQPREFDCFTILIKAASVAGVLPTGFPASRTRGGGVEVSNNS